MNPRSNTRNRKPVAPKDMRPNRHFVVAVPVKVTNMETNETETLPRLVEAFATNRGAAIDYAKGVLVKAGDIEPYEDIRFLATTTEVTAQVGDSFGGTEAIARARKTAIVELGTKVFG